MSLLAKAFRVLMIDRQAGNKSVSDLMTDLGASKERILAQVANASDIEGHREKMAHVVGIERWSQSRIKVALGESFIQEEYDGYRPDVSKSLADLTQDFAQTRDETLAIGEQLKAVDGVEEQSVAHNDMGDMRIRSWLQYLEIHAPFELKKVK